jgi:diguanylate cyclase (GGDEF)-like protein/PAS domain S-box-containing protein
MFRHIKLTTINKLIAIATILACTILAIGTIVIQKNVSLIDTTWKLYQADRSEKSRLESALRSAVGYGGMIHDFKNFVLRNDLKYMESIHKDIGFAEAIIKQYRLLQLTNEESKALTDIHNVLNAYEKVHIDIDHFFNLGYSIAQLDKLVKIDDTSALLGLQTLRREVRQNLSPNTPLSKARVSADLRAAIGYGGMIHNYKNYVLRHDLKHKKDTLLDLQKAYSAIEKFRSLELKNTEVLALKDIENTLKDYGNNLETITGLINANINISEIDKSISINDSQALQALDIIDKQIHAQIYNYNKQISKALTLVKSTSNITTSGLLIFLVAIFVFGMWLVQTQVMAPLLRLTDKMVKLSKNDLSIELENEHSDNELGDIARAVSVFKDNIIERHQAEIELEAANKKQNIQLNNIIDLKNQYEQQTIKALALTQGLTDARKLAEISAIEAEENELRVSSILNSVQDAIITTNDKGVIESINPATEKIFGFQEAELLGTNISILIPASHKNQHDKYIVDFFKDGASRNISKPVEQRALHKDGTLFCIELCINTITLANENKFIGVMKNITERKKWEKELKTLAMTDPLTNLANRNQYNIKLSEAAAVALRYKQPFALMLLDLDKFKPVNDLYGHPVGDLLLQHVAQVLIASCRETDTVARLGGDEFAVILPSSSLPLDTEALSQRIIKKISKPVTIEGHTIQIGISIGISTFPDHSDDIETLQVQADEALYQAKKNGRNTVCSFEQNK